MEWISIKDREPEIGQKILVPLGITEATVTYLGYGTINRSRKISQNGRKINRLILYWKPSE